MRTNIIASILITGFSGVALAAGSGDGGSLFSFEMLFKAINFVILFYLLYRYARKPIANMLSSSAENTKKTVDEAKAELESAKAALAECQTKMADLENELLERQKAAMAAIEAEKQQLITDAENQVKKLEAQSQSRIEQSIMKAKAEIRDFLVNESIALAEQTLSTEIGETEQKALIENYTKSIKETA